MLDGMVAHQFLPQLYRMLDMDGGHISFTSEFVHGLYKSQYTQLMHASALESVSH